MINGEHIKKDKSDGITYGSNIIRDHYPKLAQYIFGIIFQNQSRTKFADVEQNF